MASQALAPETSERVAYAELGARVGAFFIDAFICVCLFVVGALSVRLFVIASAVPSGSPVNPAVVWQRMGAGKLVFLFGLVPLCSGFFYHVLLETSGWQATVGKRVLNVYVADRQGNRIGPGRSCLRTYVKWIFLPIVYGSIASLITAACTRRRKALHDLAAGTEVLAGRPQQPAALEMWRVVAAIALPMLFALPNYLYMIRIEKLVCGSGC